MRWKLFCENAMMMPPSQIWERDGRFREEKQFYPRRISLRQNCFCTWKCWHPLFRYSVIAISCSSYWRRLKSMPDSILLTSSQPASLTAQNSEYASMRQSSVKNNQTDRSEKHLSSTPFMGASGISTCGIPPHTRLCPVLSYTYYNIVLGMPFEFGFTGLADKKSSGYRTKTQKKLWI